MTALDTVCLALGYLSLSLLVACALTVCVAGCVDAWRDHHGARRDWDAETGQGLADAAADLDDLPCGHDDCAEALDLARARIGARLISAADLAECRRTAALPARERQR